MTEITRGGAVDWRNEHRTIELRMERTAQLSQAAGTDCAAELAERQRVLGAFLADELAAGHAVVPTGSGWSQSELYRGQATLLTTDGDQAVWALPGEAFRDEVRDRHRYVMVAGGTKVGRLMDWLADGDRGLSLATAGSHKGQSVAGMLATGSHGSMLDCSGFEDHVRGVVLATGLGAAQWLAGDPVLRDDYVTRFATLADPAFFPAALVHLGGLGIISAVLLEVEDDFRLGRTKRMRVLPSDWTQRCAARDFAGAIGTAYTPAYYEITLDPFRGADHEALETILYRNEASGLLDASDPDERHILDLMVEGVTNLLAAKAESAGPEGILETDDEALLLDVPWITWMLFKDETVDEPQVGYRLSQLVGDWEPRVLLGLRIDVYNAAFAIPLDRLPEALDIGFTMGAEASRFKRDYVFTVRFAQRSPAGMGFLRFDHTAVINIDGLSKNLFGSTSHDAALELAERFEAAGLPFSMHWGKDAPSPASKIVRDFGPAVDRWTAARAALLGANAPLFTSPALEQWGLV